MAPPLPRLLLAAALLVFCIPSIQCQSTITYVDSSEDTSSSMPNPATRSYPTTITTTYTVAYSSSTAITLDRITLLDPWPTSPDPSLFPTSFTQTAITTRTIHPLFPTPSTELTLSTTTVYNLWTILPLDMPPYSPPTCPGENGCSYPAIKPASECLRRKLPTRCAAQCLLKDWMWWCRKHVEGEKDYGGRVCARTGGQEPWDVELLEPCDHTDQKPGCEICEGYSEDEGGFIGGEEGGGLGR